MSSSGIQGGASLRAHERRRSAIAIVKPAATDTANAGRSWLAVSSNLGGATLTASRASTSSRRRSRSRSTRQAAPARPRPTGRRRRSAAARSRSRCRLPAAARRRLRSTSPARSSRSPRRRRSRSRLRLRERIICLRDRRQRSTSRPPGSTSTRPGLAARGRHRRRAGLRRRRRNRLERRGRHGVELSNIQLGLALMTQVGGGASYYALDASGTARARRASAGSRSWAPSRSRSTAPRRGTRSTSRSSRPAALAIPTGPATESADGRSRLHRQPARGRRLADALDRRLRLDHRQLRLRAGRHRERDQRRRHHRHGERARDRRLRRLRFLRRRRGQPDRPGRRWASRSATSRSRSRCSARRRAIEGATSFIALQASGSVSLVGITGITASMQNVTIEVNEGKTAAGASAPALDLTKLSGGGLTGCDRAELEPDADLQRGSFSAAGTLTLSIGGFVYASGNVEFQEGTTITGAKLSDGSRRRVPERALGRREQRRTSSSASVRATRPARAASASRSPASTSGLRCSTGASGSYYAFTASAASVGLVGISRSDASLRPTSRSTSTAARAARSPSTSPRSAA